MKRTLLFLVLFTVMLSCYSTFAQNSSGRNEVKKQVLSPLLKEEPPSSKAKVGPQVSDTLSPAVTSEEPEWIDQPDTGRDRELDRKMSKRLGMTVVALIVVSFLVYFFVRFLASNKINIPALGIGQNSSLIKIIDRQALAPNKALYIVDIAGKILLLGLAENSINYLSEIERDSVEAARKLKEESKKSLKGSILSPFEFISSEKKSEADADKSKK